MAEPHDETRPINVTPNRSGRGVEFQPGQSLGGRYEVVSRLGKGGMGVVYRVNQIFLNKEFALKTVESRAMSDATVRRFQQEARTSFAVDHPNIVAVHDFGLLDDETPFLVMELINGETLGDRIKRSGSLTVEQALPIFIQICLGLAYAHECGVVHRDIKPSNVMLIKGIPPGIEGSVKILDFGIAKYTAHEGGEIQALTRTGEIFGSPAYMSPEQCSGLKIDHRADIYSLGCLFFEALTGSTPFIGDTALTTMLKHQSEIAPTLKDASLGGKFSQELEHIVARMLTKSPDQRYQNLGVLVHDLSAVMRGDPLPSERHGTNKEVANLATITMTKSRFYQILLGTITASAIVFGGTGLLLSSSQKGNSNLSKVQDTKPLSDIVVASMVNVDQAGNFHEIGEAIGQSHVDNLKLDAKTFEKMDRITSKELTVNGKKLKEFNFPDRIIGSIMTIPTYPPNAPVTSIKPVKTQGIIHVPTDAPLILDIGGNQSPWIFQNAWVLRKIGINEFDGLKIVKNKNQFAMATSPEQNNEILDSEGTVDLLNIASRWTKLKSLIIDSVQPTNKIAIALNNFPHLDRLLLAKVAVIPAAFANAPFVLRLQDLWLCQAPTDDMMRTVVHSKNLRILTLEKCKVSPESYVALQSCPHLDELFLRDQLLDDATIKAVSQIKSLKKLIVGGATLTSSQRKLFSDRNIPVLYQKYVWGIH